MKPPILLEFEPEVESERLLIRAAQAGDGVMVRTAVLESIEELKPWMPWTLNVPNEEEYEAMMRQWRLDFLARKTMYMVIIEKETGDVIGCSGFHAIAWNVPKFEIGYWCRTSKTGRGFITESTQALTNFAFEALGANRVQIRCDEENHKSAAIPKRLGFVYEGTHMAESRHHQTNELCNMMVFARTRPLTT